MLKQILILSGLLSLCPNLAAIATIPKSIDRLITQLERIDRNDFSNIMLNTTIYESIKLSLSDDSNKLSLPTLDKLILQCTNQKKTLSEKELNDAISKDLNDGYKTTKTISEIKLIFKCNEILSYFEYAYPRLKIDFKSKIFFKLSQSSMYPVSVHKQENHQNLDNQFALQLKSSLNFINFFLSTTAYLSLQISDFVLKKYNTNCEYLISIARNDSLSNKSLIFVLGHEVAHIIHGDCKNYSNSSNQKEAHSKEHKADLGALFYFKIPKEIAIQFFKETLCGSLDEKQGECETHPSDMNRIKILKEYKNDNPMNFKLT